MILCLLKYVYVCLMSIHVMMYRVLVENRKVGFNARCRFLGRCYAYFWCRNMLLRELHLPPFVTDKWVECYWELNLGLASLLQLLIRWRQSWRHLRWWDTAFRLNSLMVRGQSTLSRYKNHILSISSVRKIQFFIKLDMKFIESAGRVYSRVEV